MACAPTPRASCRSGYLALVLALSLTWACVASKGASTEAAEALSYTLTPLAQQGRLRVEIEWKTAGRAYSALGVSRQWGTLTDVPEVLGEVAADGVDSVRRQGPLWIFSHRPGATIRCRYEVEPRVRTFDWSRTHHPITTARYFHGLGNAFLLVPHDEEGVSEREFETVLRWQLPAGWKAACSWGVGRSIGQPVRAADLRNSVYLAGELKLKTVRQDGLTVDLALVEGCGLDIDEFAEMALTITRQQCRFMEEARFPPLVITAIPVGEPLKEGDTRISGTGLYNSFALFVPPGSRLDDGIEHLFAHELFHYWNGRLVQAADPERLVFWFIEGFTDYYALRILLESGRWDASTYAKWINRHLRDYQRNPAIHATNQEIQERFWTQRDTVGEVAYQRGLLLGLRWHRRARDTGVAEGVDRLLKTLVRRAAPHRRGRPLPGRLQLDHRDHVVRP
jgi:predicted metalloprotease with PDZ domain